MSATPIEAATARPAQVASSLSRAAESEAERSRAEAMEALDAIAANAETHDELREEADKRELRLAVHNLAEGVRGMIRVNPLSSILVGVAVGMMLSRRRRRRRA